MTGLNQAVTAGLSAPRFAFKRRSEVRAADREPQRLRSRHKPLEVKYSSRRPRIFTREFVEQHLDLAVEMLNASYYDLVDAEKALAAR